ncbi:MAG: hypothetical protein ACJAZP_002508 [Psychromonas sp.]|jgi:hypothetical protein|uniref:hypothetical protein n=1 Tax=Psychromonas sp. TaxID=1884585 RepID=UPI0039E36A14
MKTKGKYGYNDSLRAALIKTNSSLLDNVYNSGSNIEALNKAKIDAYVATDRQDKPDSGLINKCKQYCCGFRCFDKDLIIYGRASSKK